MPTPDLIVIGASAGGLEALRLLVRTLPPTLPAAVCVVWHMSAESPGLLPTILQQAGPLPAQHATDGDALRPGTIYVARPDQHLVLEPGVLRLTQGPKENRFRPAVDPLFRSAATAYGPRVIGVVLSGALDDGTAGLAAIKALGGIAVVQDPHDALVPGMPTSALQHVAVDYVAPAAALGALLADLVVRPVAANAPPPVRPDLALETRIALEDNALEGGVLDLGPPTPYTCPECHGTLLQITADGMMRFRCHTGHAYSLATLVSEVTASIEAALWSAIRAIDEQVLLLRHAATHAADDQRLPDADRLRAYARAAEQQKQLVRLAVLRKLDSGLTDR